MIKEGRLKKDANKGGHYKISDLCHVRLNLLLGDFGGRQGLLVTSSHTSALLKRELEGEFGEAWL